MLITWQSRLDWALIFHFKRSDILDLLRFKILTKDLNYFVQNIGDISVGLGFVYDW